MIDIPKKILRRFGHNQTKNRNNLITTLIYTYLSPGQHMPQIRSQKRKVIEYLFENHTTQWTPPCDGSLDKYCVKFGIDHMLQSQNINGVRQQFLNVDYFAAMIDSWDNILPTYQRLRVLDVHNFFPKLVTRIVKNNPKDFSLKNITVICEFFREAQINTKECIELHEFCLDVARTHHISDLKMIHYQYNIGTICMNYGVSHAGYFEKAEKIFLSCTEKYPHLLRTDPFLIELRNELAVCYSRQGRYREAYDLLLIVLEDFKKVLGSLSKEYLIAKSSLSYLNKYFGRYDEAKRVVEEVVTDMKSVLGETHQNTIGAELEHLQILHEMKIIEEKDIILHRNKISKIVGTKHNLYLHVNNLLGNFYLQKERYSEAEQIFSQNINNCKSIGKTIDPMMYMNLSISLNHQEKVEEGELYLFEGLSHAEKIYKNNGGQLLLYKYNVAEHLYDKDKFEEALRIYCDILPHLKRIFELEHSMIQNTVLGITYSLEDLGRIDEAEANQCSYIQELEGFGEKYTGALLDAKYHLGGLYFRTEKFKEAQQIYDDVLIRKEALYGEDSPKLIFIVWRLYKCAKNNKHHSSMQEHLERALHLQCTKQPSFNIKNTFTISTTLCQFYIDQNQSDSAKRLYERITSECSFDDKQQEELDSLKDAIKNM